MEQKVIWEELGHPPERARGYGGGRVARKNRGYAAEPGAGPENETCKSCKFKTYVQHAKKYLKCELMRESWTGGAGTDIKAGSPACRYWEVKPCSE